MNSEVIFTFLFAFIFLGVVGSLVHCQCKKLRMFRFFSIYIGSVLACEVVKSKHAEMIYERLSTILTSNTGEDIFDTAFKAYLKRESDEVFFEHTKALLYAFDNRYFDKVNRFFIYDHKEMMKYCYRQTGFYLKSDIIRFLFWSLLVNPVAVNHLDEM